MITYLEQANSENFSAACALDPVIGGEIRTHLSVYGTGTRDVEFWLITGEDGAPTGAVCRDFGRVRVAVAEGTPVDELGPFLQTVGWQQIQIRGLLCKRLVPLVGGMWRTAPIMRYPGGAFGGDYSSITDAPSLEEVYALNQEGGPPPSRSTRGRWYAFASHLVRHELGLISGIEEAGQLVSTGGVYAWDQDHGVIACLVTAPHKRGGGQGSLMVRYLCDRIIAQGKTPILVCAGDHLVPYYTRLGFVGAGRWGEITKRGLV